MEGGAGERERGYTAKENECVPGRVAKTEFFTVKNLCQLSRMEICTFSSDLHGENVAGC